MLFIYGTSVTEYYNRKLHYPNDGDGVTKKTIVMAGKHELCTACIVYVSHICYLLFRNNNSHSNTNDHKNICVTLKHFDMLRFFVNCLPLNERWNRLYFHIYEQLYEVFTTRNNLLLILILTPSSLYSPRWRGRRSPQRGRGSRRTPPRRTRRGTPTLPSLAWSLWSRSCSPRGSS